MALPSSGAISSSMIATELGLSISNLSLDRMGVSASLSLASSSISMSQFYGYSDQDDYKLYYYYSVGQKNADFACGNNTNAAFYFSGSGEIGFGTDNPKTGFDVKVDTFKIRSRDGKKETEFRDGRFVSKKFRGRTEGLETTGSQLVLAYTPGTFLEPTTASRGDILGSVTWEDLSIGNRDDATALRIQGKVDAVHNLGNAIKGSFRFQIGDSQPGQPINEIAILDLTGFYISGSDRSLNSTHAISIGMEPNSSTPDNDADRIIGFRNNTTEKKLGSRCK